MVKMIMINKICCFRLHSFALVWGWLGAVSSGLLAFIGMITMMNSRAIVGDFARNQLDFELSTGAATFVLMVSMLISIGLIYGVLKENHKYFLPWIFNEALACIIQIIAWIVLLVMCFVAGYCYFAENKGPEINDDDFQGYYNGNTYVTHYQYRNSGTGAAFAGLSAGTIVGGLYLAVRIYIFIGIYSLFKNYRNKKQEYEMLLENGGNESRLQ